jgi:ribosomal-protein-alanine N-acetyltransferase
MGGVKVPVAVRARHMAAADVERVAEMERSTFSSPWKADTFEALLERPGAELWVLEHSTDGVIGYFVLWCILDQGELANIAVAEAHRGKGYGAFLLQRVVDLARERGVETVYLEVRVSNAAAAKLYADFGFTQVGLRKKYYDHPVEDGMVMMLRV